MDNPQATLDFCRVLESAGADAIAVHARTRNQRSETAADWATVRHIKESLRVPLILNGDVFSYADFQRAIDETGVDSVMSARGALANPSIFGETWEDPRTVVDRYCEICKLRQNNYQNTKYTVLRILGGVTRKDKTYKDLMTAITGCKTMEEMEAVLKADRMAENRAPEKKRRL